MKIEYDDYTENLIAKIEKLSLWLWGNRIKEKNIYSWLENFNGIYSKDEKKEKQLALILLSQFMFYDLREIRQALKSIFKDFYMAPLISSFRQTTDSYNMDDYNAHFKAELQKTRFLGVGNPSESSSLLLYFFRQKNDIPKDYFAESCQLLVENEDNNKVSNLIFIDDLSASGSQAIRNLKNIIIKIRDRRKELKNEINISYFTLFATTEALEKLRNHTYADGNKLFDRVESIFELDSTYRTFAENSRYITANEEKEFFKKSCKKDYLKRCEVEDIKNEGECGYSDTQLMLGFFYNIPNNTLPIFWSDSKDWKPLFKRYNKNYKLGI